MSPSWFLVNISMRENLLAVSGNPESKEIKDLMPEILKQVGPQQYGFLKDLIDAAGKPAGEGDAADDEDDVPPLVEGNFEQAASKWAKTSKGENQKKRGSFQDGRWTIQPTHPHIPPTKQTKQVIEQSVLSHQQTPPLTDTPNVNPSKSQNSLCI